MDDNSEPEEGEAGYYSEECFNNLDDKIEKVLGRFRRNYRAALSTDRVNLDWSKLDWTKVTWYGSFLRTSQRPPSTLPPPQRPLRGSTALKFPSGKRFEGASQGNTRVASVNVPVKQSSGLLSANVPVKKESGLSSANVPIKQDHGLSSANVPIKQDSGPSSANVPLKRDSALSSANVSFKQDSGLSSAHVPSKQASGLSSVPVVQKCSSKHAELEKPVTQAPQKPLKLRIKVGNDNRAEKNAAIYGDLGLGDSPSSSLGNNPESEGLPHTSDETTGISPSNIVEIMTSFPVPGESLISPLHESLLCLAREERQDEKKEALNVRPSPSKQKTGCEVTAKRDERTTSLNIRSSLSMGKKSEGSESGKKGSDSAKEDLTVNFKTLPKNKSKGGDDVSTDSDKTKTMKLQNDINKVGHRYNKKDELHSSSQRPSVEKPKVSANGNFEVGKSTHINKSVEKPSVVESKVTEQPGQTAEASMEDWVCCDSCHKWRALPLDLKPDQLPEEWHCSMLDWLPGMNRCNIPEEVTTNALHKLYQLPVGVDQNVRLRHDNAKGADRQSKLKNKRSCDDYADGMRKKAKIESMHITSGFQTSNMIVKRDVHQKDGGQRVSISLRKRKLEQRQDEQSVLEEVKSGNSDQNPKKTRRNLASQEALDGVGTSLLGSGQASGTTYTSSSLMVSGSHKNCATVGDAKSSPVESVTSSPLMTQKAREKHISAAGKRMNIRKRATDKLCSKSTKSEKDQSCEIDSRQVCSKDSQVGTKLDSTQDLKIGNPKVSSHSDVEGKQESQCQVKTRSTCQGGATIGSQVHASVTDKPEVLKNGGNANSKTDANNTGSLGHRIPEIRNPHLNVPSTGRMNTVNKSANTVLREAKSQRDYGSWQEGATIGSQVHASVTDKPEVLKNGGNADSKTGANDNGSLGHRIPEMRNPHLNVPSTGRMNTVNKSASTVLREAKSQRDYAASLKSLGFDYESNDANFLAARKFLLGGFLIEACNSNGGRQGELNQIKEYKIASKLSERCALEYERKQEMASAALAHKCAEVANWRLIYCSSSIVSRDRSELQRGLQAIPLGESPSSSVSDNLNQANEDRATLSMDPIFHAVGNPVIVARRVESFCRVLDYTQVVNSAILASEKSRKAFSAAVAKMKELKYKECVSSLKRALDFGFYDIEEFARQVQVAMEGISHSS